MAQSPATGWLGSHLPCLVTTTIPLFVYQIGVGAAAGLKWLLNILACKENKVEMQTRNQNLLPGLISILIHHDHISPARNFILMMCTGLQSPACVCYVLPSIYMAMWLFGYDMKKKLINIHVA